MFHVLGKITKRILSGEIPSDSINPPRSMNPPPSPKAVRGGSGQGLGTPGRKGQKKK